MTTSKLLPLKTALRWEPLMAELGVSTVARSPRGFLRAYERWGQDLHATNWLKRRDGFIARHMAQLVNNDEPLYDEKGRPTCRHLALVAWAYSPDPRGLARAARSGLGTAK